MLKKMFAVVLVLSLAGVSSAFTMGGQSHDIDAMLMGMNMTSGGPVTGGNIAQAGGVVQVTDGWGVSLGQEALLGMQAVQIMGPGVATTVLDVSAMQLLGSGTNVGQANQGSNVDLMTMLMKEPGMGGLSATNSGIVTQAEVVNTPAGVISNSNTSAASTIAGMGPCSTGGITSLVDIDYCGGSSFVNPCPQTPCPPVCPPCPQPVPVCGGGC